MTRDAATSFELVAPPGGALGVIQINAPDRAACDAVLRRLRLGVLPVGSVALRDLGGIDTAIVARPAPSSIVLTPHAGPIVMTRLARWLEDTGVERRAADPHARYPEACDLVEACMLDALASAASPLAVDVLLRQPALWRADPRPRTDPERDRALGRLLTPPLVVAVGHTNIGKSTLVNVLARRTVALAADLPGTTRDHVGVTLDLAGLVVRWIDTPGVPFGGGDEGAPGPIDSAALALSRSVIARADLILSCADATSPFLDPGALGVPVLRCATRADLGPPPFPASVTTAATRGEGLDALARAVRDALVEPALLEGATPWRFHPALAGSAPAP